MAFAPQGLPRIAEWKKDIGNIPLVAIGGITLERARGVFEAGADSAAAVTDLSLSADPEQRTRDWVTATRGASLAAHPHCAAAATPRCSAYGALKVKVISDDGPGDRVASSLRENSENPFPVSFTKLSNAAA